MQYFHIHPSVKINAKGENRYRNKQRLEGGRNCDQLWERLKQEHSVF